MSVATHLARDGLPLLLALSAAAQQRVLQRLWPVQQHQHHQHQRCLSSTAAGAGSDADSIDGRPRIAAHKLHAYKARLPRARKYGPQLRDVDPAAFERMRLVLGYYDLPQNRGKAAPPPPSHVTLNQLQALWYTRDVDAYYKLALLSYRAKLANTQLAQGVARTRAFLEQLSAPPDFVPAHLEALGTDTPAPAREAGQQQPAGSGGGAQE